jgi:hypothetical protein
MYTTSNVSNGRYTSTWLFQPAAIVGRQQHRAMIALLHLRASRSTSDASLS